MGWGKPQGIAKIELRTDSATAVVMHQPEHFATAFNAQTLESAIKAKYVGGGIGLGGLFLINQGKTDAGIAVSLLGSITSFVGIVVQDIQSVRLGWKHEDRTSKARNKKGSTSTKLSCDESNLTMGEKVAFQSSIGVAIEGEIIGIVSNALGCQIIVAYELDGERKTSTLAPSGLTKLQTAPQPR